MTIDARHLTALGLCQMLLKQREADRGAALQTEDIREVVGQIVAMPGFTMVDKDQLLKDLEERFTIRTPNHKTLGAQDDHSPWLPAKRASVCWRYWDRYRLLLNERMPPSAVDSIDTVTNDVLERLEDPERRGPWDRRGLVMGHVQSGKTASYCGLICKAADAGYKVIIVLSGIHNSLRSQTQIRLDEGFLGFMSEAIAVGAPFRRAGVGLIDAGIVANTATNRTERGDFNRTVANQFGIHPGGMPLLFVTKKNVSVLRNLNNWLTSCANAEDESVPRRFIKEVSLLVIDDEADLASIDTRLQAVDESGTPDPDHDPAETNKQIRKLLRAFEKAAYVGYTATPFANIYIYDQGFTPALGDDLFPRSFIVSIPPPSNHMGPSRVFGMSGDEDADLQPVKPLPVLRIVSDHADSLNLDETRGWMPPRLVARTEHIPRHRGRQVIPPSLGEALRAFILSTAVRQLRACTPLHNSMLVHVARYTKVQALVARQVAVALKEIVQRLRNGDGDRRPTIQDEFQDLWQHDFMPTHTSCGETLEEYRTIELPHWSDVQGQLLRCADGIRVKVINGSAGDVLDYEDHKTTGISVIAVGGDKLSRGLTLEGLTVSYFLRASKMYDTLMQMGRWFGYRDRYVDVCRLYTTAELLSWFTHITAASEELQREFEHMVKVGGTPKDYGLKVRSHPALLVTSAVKMRHGEEMRLSFSGDISETIIFDRDPRWIERNYLAAASWLKSLGAPSRGKDDRGGYTWIKVGSDQVLEFLKSYTCHPAARRVDAALLSRYISTQNKLSELMEWTVHLVSSEASDATAGEVGGLKVGLIIRGPFPKPEDQMPDQYRIRRLVSPRDEAIDLTPEQLQLALEKTTERWQNDPKFQGATPERPGGLEIREKRGKQRGLLLLYPMDPPAELGMAGTSPVIGIAISFPTSDTARDVTYTVNNVFTRQGGDDDNL